MDNMLPDPKRKRSGSPSSVLMATAGASLGYAIGKNKDVPAQPNADELSALREEKAALETLVESQRNMISLQQESIAIYEAETAYTDAQLEAKLAAIASLESELVVTAGRSASDYQATFGLGSPFQSGWVEGRDGLMFHRALRNFYDVDAVFQEFATAVDYYADFAYMQPNPLSILLSDPVRTAAPYVSGVLNGDATKGGLRKIGMRFGRGITPRHMIVLNFDGPVEASDMMVSGCSYWANNVVALPLGPKSVGLVCVGGSWDATVDADYYALNDRGASSSDTATSRFSFLGTPYSYGLSFAFSQPQSVKIRSYNIVSSPFRRWFTSMARNSAMLTSLKMGVNLQAQTSDPVYESIPTVYAVTVGNQIAPAGISYNSWRKT